MSTLVGALRAATPAPLRAATRQFRLDRALARHLFDGREELDAFRAELADLWPVIDAAHERWVAATGGIMVRGHPATFANIRPVSAGRLYALIRKLKPEILVETGVCNGVSSAVILQALDTNGCGRLHSVDLPEFADLPSTEHWEGKRGAIVPKGQDPGWLVPEQLRERWQMTIGRSQDVLPQLLEDLGRIDFFMHDSEHSYECMRFEMEIAEQHLTPGAPLVVDDADWNTAFGDFVQSRGLPSWNLDGGTYMTAMASASRTDG